MIYDFYKYCKIEKPTGTITYIYNELNKNDKMPNYILNYFYDIINECKNNKNNKDDLIKNKLENKENFIKNIELKLVNDIENFLGLNKDEDI